MPRMFVSQELPAPQAQKLYPTVPPEVENWYVVCMPLYLILLIPALKNRLRTDIESNEGGTIAKSKLYEMYEEFCKDRLLRPCPPNTFGKVVRKVSFS